ncbi:hypothetical protein [Caballeronia sp. GAFFF2]|uniref:hypothetical protein n=1 Tax=Caballeronia sp. GAFFF2 TaxID=2921741 RepID=UPI0020282AF3|nr:hypothetical protein [Caballeronia sp. GAFFF2]
MHHARLVGVGNDIQGAIRSYPEAFLARTVIVCEGASEIGLIRGLDYFWVSNGSGSLQSASVAYIDSHGGEPDECFWPAKAFQALGYRVAILQDSDKPASANLVQEFGALGGYYVALRNAKALEDELFTSLPDAAVTALITRALELTEDGKVDAHIKTFGRQVESCEHSIRGDDCGLHRRVSRNSGRGVPDTKGRVVQV